VIDLRGKTSFADKMIIADGRSERHVGALASTLAKELKALGLPQLTTEGTESCDWVLIDAGDVVVHLFKPHIREIYQLERMWGSLPPEEYARDPSATELLPA
jgi:ribosome-associated protein